MREGRAQRDVRSDKEEGMERKGWLVTALQRPEKEVVNGNEEERKSHQCCECCELRMVLH